MSKTAQYSSFNIHHSLGFTLVEVLVAIAIMAFVAAVAIPGIRNLSSDQDLDNDSSNLKNMLRTAHSSAGSNIKCASGQPSTSWRVRLTASTFELYSTCNISGNETLSTKTFSSGISILSTSCTTLPAEIIFSGKTTSYTCASGTPGATFNITLTNPKNTQKQININLGGVISD